MANNLLMKSSPRVFLLQFAWFGDIKFDAKPKSERRIGAQLFTNHFAWIQPFLLKITRGQISEEAHKRRLWRKNKTKRVIDLHKHLDFETRSAFEKTFDLD
jgi:hypothetical protein